MIDGESSPQPRQTVKTNKSGFGTGFVASQRKTLQDHALHSGLEEKSPRAHTHHTDSVPERRRSIRKPTDAAANTIQKAFRSRQSTKSLGGTTPKPSDFDTHCARRELDLFNHIFMDESPNNTQEVPGSEGSFSLDALFETLPYQPDNRRRRITGGGLEEEFAAGCMQQAARRQGHSKRRHTEGGKPGAKKKKDPEESAATRIQQAFRNRKAEKDVIVDDPIEEEASDEKSNEKSNAAGVIQQAFRRRKRRCTEGSKPVFRKHVAECSKNQDEDNLEDSAAMRIQQAFRKRKSEKPTEGTQRRSTCHHSADTTPTAAAASAIQKAFRKRQRRHTGPAIARRRHNTDDEQSPKGGQSLADVGGPSNTSNRARQRASKEVVGRHKHRSGKGRSSKESVGDSVKKRGTIEEEEPSFTRRKYTQEHHAAATRIQRSTRTHLKKKATLNRLPTDITDMETWSCGTQDSSPISSMSYGKQDWSPRHALSWRQSVSRNTPPQLAGVTQAPSLEDLWPHAPQSRCSVTGTVKQVPGYEMAKRLQRRISSVYGSQNSGNSEHEQSPSQQVSRRPSRMTAELSTNSNLQVTPVLEPSDESPDKSSRRSSGRRGQSADLDESSRRSSRRCEQSADNQSSPPSSRRRERRKASCDRSTSPRPTSSSPRPSGALVVATLAAGKGVDDKPTAFLELYALQPCLRKSLTQRITLPPVKDKPGGLKRRPVPSGIHYRAIRSLPGPASDVMRRLADHWREYKVAQITELRMSQIVQRRMDPLAMTSPESSFSRQDDAFVPTKLAAQAVISPTEASLCSITARQGTLSAPPPAFSRCGHAGSFRQCWMSQRHRY